MVNGTTPTVLDEDAARHDEYIEVRLDRLNAQLDGVIAQVEALTHLVTEVLVARGITPVVDVVVPS